MINYGEDGGERRDRRKCKRVWDMRARPATKQATSAAPTVPTASERFRLDNYLLLVFLRDFPPRAPILPPCRQEIKGWTRGAD